MIKYRYSNFVDDRRWQIKTCNFNPNYEGTSEVDQWNNVYMNEFDGGVERNCPAGKHVARMKSVDDKGGKNDRRWWFGCKKGGDEGIT